MDVQIYRAKTIHDALAIVRRELGGEASVLRTRAIQPKGLSRWLGGERMIEVVASATVSAPSRIPAKRKAPAPLAANHPSRAMYPSAGIDLTAPSAALRFGASDCED